MTKDSRQLFNSDKGQEEYIYFGEIKEVNKEKFR